MAKPNNEWKMSLLNRNKEQVVVVEQIRQSLWIQSTALLTIFRFFLCLVLGDSGQRGGSIANSSRGSSIANSGGRGSSIASDMGGGDSGSSSGITDLLNSPLDTNGLM